MMDNYAFWDVEERIVDDVMEVEADSCMIEDVWI